MIRRSLTEVPHRPCDKLFVPPNIADSINRAVHAVSVLVICIGMAELT